MGGDRKAAFVQAWIIVKAGGLTLPVRGVSFGSRQEAIRRLSRYNPADVRAVLVPEPTNIYDPHAVAVMVEINGGRGLYKIGYIPAAMTAAVSVLHTLPAVQVTGDTVHGLRLHFAV
jgi:hypothetical protein